MLNRKGLVRSSTTFSTPSVISGHHAEAMSALPPKADIANGRRSVQAVSSVKHEYLERGECQQGLVPLRCFWRGRRIPLAATHARDLYALEQAGLAEWLIARKFLGLLTAWHVDDETASSALDPVVAEQRSAQQQDVLVPVEIGEMLVLVGSADLGAVISVFLIDDVEHALSSCVYAVEATTSWPLTWGGLSLSQFALTWLAAGPASSPLARSAPCPAS